MRPIHPLLALTLMATTLLADTRSDTPVLPRAHVGQVARDLAGRLSRSLQPAVRPVVMQVEPRRTVASHALVLPPAARQDGVVTELLLPHLHWLPPPAPSDLLITVSTPAYAGA